MSTTGTPRVAPVLPEGRRSVLYAVRRRGEATAEQVAEQLRITVSGARQQLSALVESGLAEAREVPRAGGGRGRRPIVYAVTAAGDALFPKADERTVSFPNQIQPLRSKVPLTEQCECRWVVLGGCSKFIIKPLRMFEDGIGFWSEAIH